MANGETVSKPKYPHLFVKPPIVRAVTKLHCVRVWHSKESGVRPAGYSDKVIHLAPPGYHNDTLCGISYAHPHKGPKSWTIVTGRAHTCEACKLKLAEMVLLDQPYELAKVTRK